MHLPGGFLAPASTLASPVWGPPGLSSRGAVLDAWAAWSALPGADGYLAPGAALIGWTVARTVAAAVALLLLGAWLAALADRQPQPTTTPDGADARLRVGQRLAAWAFVPAALVPAGVLFAEAGSSSWLVPVAYLSALTWVLVLAAAVCGISFAWSSRDRRTRTAVPWRPLRGHLGVAACFAVVVLLLPGDLGRQISDILLRYGQPDALAQAVATVVLVALLCVLIAASAGVCLRAARPVAVGGDSAPDGPGLQFVTALAVVPAAVVMIAAVRGAVALAVVADVGRAWLVVALVLALAVTCLGVGRRARAVATSRAAGTVTAVLSTVFVVGGLWSAIAPLHVATWLGPLAILVVVQGAAVALVTPLVLLGERPAPRPLARLGFRRLPTFTALALVAFLASTIDAGTAYHDVRLVETPGRDVALADAVEQWIDDVAADTADDAAEGVPTVPLVLVASAGGGIRSAYWTSLVLDCLFASVPDGTCRGDEEALDPRYLFALSGISGGSVGIGGFRAANDGAIPTRSIFRSVDVLSPVVAALAFRDGPHALLRWGGSGHDRAAVHEQAFERAAELAGADFGMSLTEASWADERLRFPLLMFNATSVSDGCRVTASVLDGVPDGHAGRCLEADAGRIDRTTAPLVGTHDVYDTTCRAGDAAGDGSRDVRLVTAALLSARFPIVSPAGELPGCATPRSEVAVLDGGLIEATGAAALTDLWAALLPLVEAANRAADARVCVEPRLLLIDNAYQTTARHIDHHGNVRQLTSMRHASGAAFGSLTPLARQASVQAVIRSVEHSACADTGGADVSAVAHAYPLLHPGPVPPLGWVLSSTAQESLEEQVCTSPTTIALETVRSWWPSSAGRTAREDAAGEGARGADLDATWARLCARQDPEVSALSRLGA